MPTGIPTLNAVTDDAFNSKYLFLKLVSVLLSAKKIKASISKNISSF
jgi:hypothetical protein